MCVYVCMCVCVCLSARHACMSVCVRSDNPIRHIIKGSLPASSRVVEEVKVTHFSQSSSGTPLGGVCVCVCVCVCVWYLPPPV